MIANLKEVRGQISGLMNRNHISGIILWVRLPNKSKPNNYSEIDNVNVADRSRGVAEHSEVIVLIDVF